MYILLVMVAAAARSGRKFVSPLSAAAVRLGVVCQDSLQRWQSDRQSGPSVDSLQRWQSDRQSGPDTQPCSRQI